MTCQVQAFFQDNQSREISSTTLVRGIIVSTVADRPGIDSVGAVVALAASLFMLSANMLFFFSFLTAQTKLEALSVSVYSIRIIFRPLPFGPSIICGFGLYRLAAPALRDEEVPLLFLSFLGLSVGVSLSISLAYRETCRAKKPPQMVRPFEARLSVSLPSIRGLDYAHSH
jgi:hypothetical protein